MQIGQCFECYLEVMSTNAHTEVLASNADADAIYPDAT